MKRHLSRFFIRLGLVTFTFLALGPVIWAVITSLLPLSALTSRPPDLTSGTGCLRGPAAGWAEEISHDGANMAAHQGVGAPSVDSRRSRRCIRRMANETK